MNAIEKIAEFVATGCPIEDDLLRSRAIDAVSDVIGCIIAGADSGVALKAYSAFCELAPGEVPLIGTNRTLAPPFAALVNAMAGHAYDFDDWEEPANTHPSVVMVPALLAAAHIKPANGAHVLQSYATGFEVIARLGQALTLDHYARGFHTTATLGTIGAAAAVSHLLKLDKAQTANALALSVSQATGYTCQFGSNAKATQAGFAAKSGLVCAFMAKAGITGQSNVLDAARGMNGLMAAGTDESFGKALNSIGSPPALVEYGVLLKPWPSCGYTHRLMTCAIELRAQHSPEARNIAGIKATLPDFHKAVLPFGNPTSKNEALFSAEACIAQALLHARLSLEDLDMRFWEASDVTDLIERTKVRTETPIDPTLNYDPRQPDRLEVVLKSGEILAADCTYPLGAPQNPMSMEQVKTKFCDITKRNPGVFDAVSLWHEAADFAGHIEAIGACP